MKRKPKEDSLGVENRKLGPKAGTKRGQDRPTPKTDLTTDTLIRVPCGRANDEGEGTSYSLEARDLPRKPFTGSQGTPRPTELAPTTESPFGHGN